MATVQHNVLTTTNLHEPKGVAAATAGQIYRADGAASGAWQSTQYGSIHTLESASHTLATIGTTKKLFAGFLTDGVSSGCTVAHGTDSITVALAGVYWIDFNLTFSTVGAGDSGTYHFHVRVDNVESAFGVGRYMSGTNDTGSAGIGCLLTLAASEVITIWVDSDNGSNIDDINVEHAVLTVVGL